MSAPGRIRTAVVALVLAACGGDGTPGSARINTTTTTTPVAAVTTVAPAPATTDVAAPTTGSPTAPVATAPPPTSAAGPAVGDPSVATEKVAGFTEPIDLAVRPGDDALYVVEQPGRVVRYDGAPTVVADVSDRTASEGEQGLLGLEFSSDGTLAYLDFTVSDEGLIDGAPAGATVIAEYPVAADGTFDVGAQRVLLVVAQPYRNHNGGDLELGADGMLYIALGDGGQGGDPDRRANDPSDLLGSLLRIDPTPSGDRPYTIPPDNPFAEGPIEIDGVMVDGAPEVWSWGLRNPWRFAFDPPTGNLWIADVGQNAFEEVDVVHPTADHPAGWAADFGWSAFEGLIRFNEDVPASPRMIEPVLVYEHGDDGCSISGGVVYRGTAIDGLEPAYVYSDFCSGKLWALDLVGGRNLVLATGLDAVAGVRTGPDGELYVLQRSGDLLRLVPA